MLIETNALLLSQIANYINASQTIGVDRPTNVLFHALLNQLEMWTNIMPNVMAALPNIGGALCSTP